MLVALGRFIIRRMVSMRALSLIAFVTLGLSGGCKDDIVDVSQDECASGRKWVGGEKESPLMFPGRDCVACHRGEGPDFVLAGTVYPEAGLNDPNNCLGIEGASVLIEGAGGQMYSLETNEAGNFYLSSSTDLTFPARVTVEYQDATREMVMDVPDGACATCHSAEGSSGAAGRIIVP